MVCTRESDEKQSDSGSIWKAEPMIFSDKKECGIRGKRKSKDDLGFAQQMDRTCRQLRWGDWERINRFEGETSSVLASLSLKWVCITDRPWLVMGGPSMVWTWHASVETIHGILNLELSELATCGTMLSHAAGQRQGAARLPSQPSDHGASYSLWTGSPAFGGFCVFSHPSMSTKRPTCVACCKWEEEEGNYCWDEQDTCPATGPGTCSEPAEGRLGCELPQVRSIQCLSTYWGFIGAEPPLLSRGASVLDIQGLMLRRPLGTGVEASEIQAVFTQI